MLPKLIQNFLILLIVSCVSQTNLNYKKEPKRVKPKLMYNNVECIRIARSADYSVQCLFPNTGQTQLVEYGFATFLFDYLLIVCAYCVFTEKKNYIFSVSFCVAQFRRER